MHALRVSSQTKAILYISIVASFFNDGQIVYKSNCPLGIGLQSRLRVFPPSLQRRTTSVTSCLLP